MANEKIAKFNKNIEEIINELTDEEVLSLATTITGGLLKNKINSRQDSLKVILNYSEDIPSLLRRKVFTREKLLSYLHDKNVSIKLPVTKLEIIEKVVQLWTNEKSDFQASNTFVETQNNLDDFSVGSSRSMGDEALSDENNQHKIIAKTSNENEIPECNNDINVKNTVKLLAEQFSNWFYKLLNENELSPDHFYPDAVLTLAITFNGDTNTTNVCNDPAAVTKTILNIKDQYNLFFNPNLMRESLKAQMDSHGLVIITVGGTLHIDSICVGVFEQLFALARDPFAENNWKIKRTDLHLINGNSSDVPSSLSDVVTKDSNMHCTEIAK